MKKGVIVKKPPKLDMKKADDAIRRLIRENTEWLKEMARK